MRDPENTRSPSLTDLPAFLRTFADPRGDSAPMPFWMWNGALDEREIRRQIGLMDTAGVEAFVIHPREGLETPYLSDQWFGMVKAAVAEAHERRMKVWIYDELNWPSGYAGGKLLEEDFAKCARHLARVTVEAGGKESLRHRLSPGEQLVAAFALDKTGVARAIRAELTAPFGIGQPGLDTPHSPHEWDESDSFCADQPVPHPNIPIDQIGSMKPHQPLPGTPRKTSAKIQLPILSGTSVIDLYISRPTSFSVTYRPGLRYTDLLDPGAVRLFISLVHERYLRQLHDYFGTTVLGFFTDEPGFYNNLHGCDPDTVPWTAGFPDYFRELKGYDLLPRLGALWQPPADGGGIDAEAARIRADFFDALAERYRSSYFAQLHDWCRANGLQLIGHLLGEEDLLATARSQGDFFRHFRHLDQAGVDLVGRVSEEQSVSVRLGASAALHLGRGQLQSETFGLFGWGLSLEKMRHTADWQAVRGLTRLVPHAFHYSMAGQRHRECPPSLFFQNCWWPLYPRFQAYGRRLFAALEQGRPEAAVALFYPLPGVWADLSAGPEGEAAARTIDTAFRGLALALERAQIDFHILDGEMIGRAEVEGDGALTLSGCRYTALILPQCRTLPPGMAEKLERFTTHGGLLAAVGRLPELELADAGGETDSLGEWSARLFPGDIGDGGSTGDTPAITSFGEGRTLFVHRDQVATSHPAQSPRLLSVLRGLRRVGAAVAPRLETRATNSYKRWLSRQRGRAAEAVAGSSPFAGLVDTVAAHAAPVIRILPPDPDIRHLRKWIEGDHGGALVFLLNQGEIEKRFTAALTGPGRPWRLDPADGSAAPVHNCSIDLAGRILIPLTLPPFGSALFYLEQAEPLATRIEETNLDEILTLRLEPESTPDVVGIAWSNGKKWARVVDSNLVKTSSPSKVAKIIRQEWFLVEQVGNIPDPMNLAHGWEICFPPMEGGQFEDELRDKYPQETVLSNQPLQDWRVLGRGRFSGSAGYSISFELDDSHVGYWTNFSEIIANLEKSSGNIDASEKGNGTFYGNYVAMIDLGEVRETARVILNGRPAGDLPWPPYKLRVEQLLRWGRNQLTVVVTNTMANRLDPAPLPSGLLGPVRLIFGRKLKLEFNPDSGSQDS